MIWHGTNPQGQVDGVRIGWMVPQGTSACELGEPKSAHKARRDLILQFLGAVDA
jgi:hypothetical protein